TKKPLNCDNYYAIAGGGIMGIFAIKSLTTILAQRRLNQAREQADIAGEQALQDTCNAFGAEIAYRFSNEPWPQEEISQSYRSKGKASLLHRDVIALQESLEKEDHIFTITTWTIIGGASLIGARSIYNS